MRSWAKWVQNVSKAALWKQSIDVIFGGPWIFMIISRLEWTNTIIILENIIIIFWQRTNDYWINPKPPQLSSQLVENKIYKTILQAVHD